jgi:hypothetical protein
MSKTLRKKTTFNELPLYRSINMFMLFITPVLFNCSKDIKQTYGDKIIKLGIETLVILKKKLQFSSNLYYGLGIDEMTFIKIA